MIPEVPGTIALANGQELNCLRPVSDSRETKGAPVNPLTPVVTPGVPTPQPVPQTAPKR
jgi:hypothetical protein